MSDGRMDELAGTNVQVWPVMMLVPLMSLAFNLCCLPGNSLPVLYGVSL